VDGQEVEISMEASEDGSDLTELDEIGGGGSDEVRAGDEDEKKRSALC